MTRTTRWLLVADEAIARILELSADATELVPVEELTDPDAHASDAEMRHGPHGRRAAGASGGSQATVSAGDSEKHQHARQFAARVAQRLLRCLDERRFEALHVVAAPRLLGYLREAFEPRLTAAVVRSVDKDLIHESNADLLRRFFASPPSQGG